MIQPGWDELDNKEKDLCIENNIRPEDYLQLKKQIVIEHAKNRAITEAFVKEKGKELKNVRDKVPTIYDFWVKTNIISNK